MDRYFNAALCALRAQKHQNAGKGEFKSHDVLFILTGSCDVQQPRKPSR